MKTRVESYEMAAERKLWRVSPDTSFRMGSHLENARVLMNKKTETKTCWWGMWPRAKYFALFHFFLVLFFIHFLTARWLACELRNEDEAKTTLNHFSAQPKQMGNITIRVPATSAISQERPCKCNSRSRTNHKSWETVAPMDCELSSPSNLWRFCASAQRFFIFPPATSFFFIEWERAWGSVGISGVSMKTSSRDSGLSKGTHEIEIEA